MFELLVNLWNSVVGTHWKVRKYWPGMLLKSYFCNISLDGKKEKPTKSFLNHVFFTCNSSRTGLVRWNECGMLMFSAYFNT